MSDTKRSREACQNIPLDLSEDHIFVNRRIVMYPDLNAHGFLFGGQLMSWLDEGTTQVAGRIMRTDNLVTKKFGEIVFENPSKLGDSVEIWCRVAKEGTTSLTLECRVLVRGLTKDRKERAHQICTCTVVYVALDELGRPMAWKNG